MVAILKIKKLLRIEDSVTVKCISSTQANLRGALRIIMNSMQKITSFFAYFTKFRRQLLDGAYSQWKFQNLRDEITHRNAKSLEDLRNKLIEIDEWRFSDLMEKLAFNNEWRFKDLKLYLHDGLPRDTSFTLERSLADLNRLGDSRKSAIAIVSVLPPASTGIARFTAKTFGHLSRPVDFYTPVQSGFEYLLQNEHHKASGSNTPILTIDALPHGVAVRNYAFILFVLGNSDHHIPVMRILRRTKDMSSCPPLCIEVHDPIILNICTKTLQFENTSLREALQSHSVEDLSSVDWTAAESGDHTELVAHGCTGFPVLLRDIPIHSLIFHSEPSREIVLRDWPEFSRDRTATLFHPVFERFNRRSSTPREYDSAIKIGTFGVPSRGKQTDLVIAAFEILKKSHPGSSLIIAGYGAADFARAEGINAEGIKIYDSPDDVKLIELMESVDIAVQLRIRNTGESSGIVPQLLACDTPCICTPIGAFQGFGDAVEFFNSGPAADDLARSIVDVANASDLTTEARRKYVEGHAPSKFCRAFEVFYIEAGLLRSMGDDGVPNLSRRPVGTGIELRDFGSYWDENDPRPLHWTSYESLISAIGASDDPYVQKHTRRYRHTLAALETVKHVPGGACLEVGTSWIFSILLRRQFGYTTVDVTDFDPSTEDRIVQKNITVGDNTEAFRAFNINLEQQEIPVESHIYDLIICCEVLEHMDVDPMFMLSELNRVAKVGCCLILTTPNVTSGRNVMKILNGYAPHFFMQYHKDRSPYRHNLEYAPDQVVNLLNGGGFEVEKIWTANTFEAPDLQTERFLKECGFPDHMRGDNMFLIARKTGPVVDRHPSAVYV